ncbi:MAG TPA: carbohydrate ABC transporter permease, partial [Petrotogaceae bacterium]|nr:carbohydrate ABC transporter permease [Petrotogaceae bacterium]
MAVRSKKVNDAVFYTFCYVILIVFAIIFLFPFIWMVLSTFKTQNELMAFPPRLLPKSFSFSNYKEIFDTVPFGKFYINSLIVTTCAVFLQLLTSSMAGFAFAKYDFRGKNGIFKTLVSAMMIPFPVTIIPLYIMVYSLGMVDTYAAMIVSGCVSIFGTFLMRQFIMGIPNDLLEAARIDGCGEWMIYTKIILPNIKPVLSALGIFGFMSSWNAFLWPLLVVNDNRHRTVQLGVQFFSQQ